MPGLVFISPHPREDGDPDKKKEFIIAIFRYSLYYLSTMNFYSTENKNLSVSFQEALLSGMAKDGGLFMPETIPVLSEAEKKAISSKSLGETAALLAQKFIEGEIPEAELKAICEEAYDFPVPLHELGENDLVLELFHGPTLAFKDFAARFMSRCVDYFLSKKSIQKNILVATSGDTGGAIGNGFLGLKSANVFILYPQGGVSPIQEKQLTTIGGNVQAVEITGSFDDCQRLVKEAFKDRAFNDKYNLMSANSINIGRFIPQSFYYVWISLKLQKQYPGKKIVFSVPSGNFGNIFGGILAKAMGAPIHKFIAANNKNHPFFDFLKTGNFEPIKSVQTLSNAMDIGSPNNFARIWEFFGKKVADIREVIWGDWSDDAMTAKMMQKVYQEKKYLMCPHTAVGYLGVQKFKEQFGKDFLFVTVSTAHPAKFAERVEEIIKEKIEIPDVLAEALKKPKKATLLPPNLIDLENFLIEKL